MKKILYTLTIILLTGFVANSQIIDANKLKIKGNRKQNDATRILVMDSITKETNWILKSTFSPAGTVGSLQQVTNAGATTTNAVTANSFIKSGGTSDQILLANGSTTVLSAKANLDSPALTGTPVAPTAPAGNNTNQIATTTFVQNAVATSNAVLRTGDQTIVGLKSFTNFGNAKNVEVQNGNTQIGSSALNVNNFNEGKGILSENASVGVGIYSNSTSTGLNYVGANAGTTTFSVDKIGNVNANSFVKTGGQPTQFLMADGSVNSTSYLSSIKTVNNQSLLGSGNIDIAGASGTVNTLSKFTTATSLGNSNITDTGTLVTVNSGLKVKDVVIGRPLIDAAQSSFTIGNNLNSLTTGLQNIAFGENNLNYLKTGSNNIAIGTGIGQRVSVIGTLADNVAVGHFAMANIDSAINNVAIGNNSQRSNQSGTGNTSVGNGSFFSIISGQNNTGVGNSAGQLNNGNNNVFLGSQSGVYLSNKSSFMLFATNSIFIGHLSSPQSDTQTNQIVIGQNANGLGSNSTVLGSSLTQKTAIFGRLLLGTTVDNTIDQLQVSGTIAASPATTANQVVVKSQLDLKQDNLVSATNIKTVNNQSLLGSGNIDLGSPSGTINTLSKFTTATNLGNSSITDDGTLVTVNSNFKAKDIVIGRPILDPTQTNFTIGDNLRSLTTGTKNIAIGDGNQTGITTGSQNITIGSQSLRGSAGFSNASDNVSIGHYAMNNSYSAFDNTAIGTQSLSSNANGSRNTAVGKMSAANLSFGNDNTSLGYYTGGFGTGNFNVSLGAEAGKYLNNKTTTLLTTTGSIFIGHQSSAEAVSQTNQIVIGKSANGLGSNSTVLGNSSTVKTAIFGRLLLGTTVDNTIDQVQVSGSLLATSIKKLNGLSTQFLMADGSVTTGGSIPTLQQVTTAGATTTVALTASSFIKAGASADEILLGNGTTALLSEKANLVSPTFTGIVNAPTPAAETNTTQIATTAFVKNALDIDLVGRYVTEAGNKGIVFGGRDRSFYGNIGLDAVDFSYSDTPSTVFGATGESSFAAGMNNISSGYNSTTFGFLNTNNSVSGFVAGTNNQSSGYVNTVMGAGNSVTGTNITVVGQAANIIAENPNSNNIVTSPVFVVGNGTITDANVNYPVTARSDAFVVRKNGLIEAPSLSIAKIDAGSDKTLATKEYVKKITVRKIATNTTLTNSDNGSVILLTASATVTLPNGLSDGFNISFATQAGATLTYALGTSIVLINNSATSMSGLSSHTLVNTGVANEYLTVGL